MKLVHSVISALSGPAGDEKSLESETRNFGSVDSDEKRRLRKEYDNLMLEHFPYMIDYYREKQAHELWFPFLMHAPQQQTSPAFNTDSLGMRLTAWPDGRTASLASLPIDGEVNLLIGSSSVFGWGASSDKATISSCLSRTTHSNWLNAGMNGCVNIQNLLMLLVSMPVAQKIGKFVILSGVNELTSFFFSRIFPKRFGSHFCHNQFFQELNARLIDEAGRVDRSNLPDWFEYIEDHTAQIALVMEAIAHALRAWSIFARSFNAELIFVLQPVYGWHDKKLAFGESEAISRFDAFSGYGSDQYGRMIRFLNQAYKNGYPASLEQECARLDISFHDLNRHFSQGLGDDQWISIDRVHHTDLGNNLVCKCLVEILEGS